VFAGAPAEVSSWAAEATDRFGNTNNPNLVGALATAAVGAWRHGDAERAIMLASRGVELGSDRLPATRWALDALGDANIIAGHYDQAICAYEAAIPLAESVGDIVTATNDRGSIAIALAYGGQSEEAVAQADTLLRTTMSVTNPSALGMAHYFAGEVRLESQPGEALPLLRRAITEAERAGNRFLLGIASASAVSLDARLGDGATGLERYASLITHWQQTGARTQFWITVRSFIEALQRSGQNEAAAVLYGALTASPTASPLAGADARRLADVVVDLVAQLGQDEFDALRAEGAAMGDEAATSNILDLFERPIPIA
jgi:tetratricopeptide (TPR) repeat protein